MRVIEPLLKIKDMMRIYGMSRVSVYRKVADARAGRGGFPLPLTGYKKQLLWNPDEVERYCQAQPAAPPVNVPSPSKQTKLMRERREHTAAILAEHGIKLNSTQKGV